MILSAVSLWKKFNTKTPLGASEWGEERNAVAKLYHVSYSGHAVADGCVRIYARYGCPNMENKDGKEQKYPTILLLPDAGKAPDDELITYFVEKGYAVLMPDYSGKMSGDKEGVKRTVYPQSLEYGNYEFARGLNDMQGLEADKTTWFEWTYVALFSLEYLRTRTDVGNIGVVGIRKGGEIAWQVMLSPEIKCGIPINAAGWRSFLNVAKFGDNVAHNLSDDTHRYIAAAEAQSYAPYVKCPVLLLCALHDGEFDCDRAYDTYSRIGNEDGNALVYSWDSGACIGPSALATMDMFLVKNLKGREIYIPDTLNVTLTEDEEGLRAEIDCDKEGILEETGLFYAESDVKTKSAYRDWHRIFKADGKSVKNGKAVCKIKPFKGATAVFVFAYAKYINGFRVMSKITCKRLSNVNVSAVKSRMLFSGKELDGFGVAQYEDYSIGEIFLENEAIPKEAKGYGGISGAYSVGGIKTYKISSPQYIPEENALLEFDVYFKEDSELRVSIDVADVENGPERYSCYVPVKGGGKWKRIILKSADFKGETFGMPLRNFYEGRALLFDCEEEEKEYAVTNILWL